MQEQDAVLTVGVLKRPRFLWFKITFDKVGKRLFNMHASVAASSSGRCREHSLGVFTFNVKSIGFTSQEPSQEK